jgi:peptidoglycan/xylan/chitin deacetylase (PgdA/CDA1 family)
MMSLMLRALLILLLGASVTTIPTDIAHSHPTWTITEGGVTRGDTGKKQIALIFTGGDFGEGTDHILTVLAHQNIKASFFVTGDFLRKPELVPLVQRAIKEGHYVGPHSDKHPLYCPWEDRHKTLVTREDFASDLQKNIADLRTLGALQDKSKPVYFIPPYEWYNADQSNWSREMNVLLFNFTPGSGSNRDWAPEDHKSFVPSQQIIDDILKYEQKDEHGLNGFLLLLHVGSQRKDKTFLLLEPLLENLKKRGYSFVRVDQLLEL